MVFSGNNKVTPSKTLERTPASQTAREESLSAPVLGGESNHTRPTLKIQDDCNLRCSYCVIPFVRGKSRSLPPETVIQEIQLYRWQSELTHD
jgi:tRNA A37 methylthiotransferase MiaB